ncbi:MAG: NAD(P)/FAD-dependent oxidoreductase [Oscillospiraceae bacterium]
MNDVIIIGCGIIGAAAMYELSKYKLDILCLEAENDVSTGTTKANSAILHAGYDPEPGSLMAKLNVEGVRLAKDLCFKLDVPYRRTGSFVLGFNNDDVAKLWELYNNGIANGLEELAILDGDEVRRREPNISKDVIAALYAPQAAIVSPWEYALALAETGMKNGAKLALNTRVLAIDKLDVGFRVHTDNGDYEAKTIINAAGVHSDEIHNMVANPTFTIEPSRGEYYLLDKSEGATVNSVIFKCPNKDGKGVLVAPTVHGNLIVGPNAETSQRDSVANTAEGLEYVSRMAAISVPSVNMRASIRNFAGVRANSDKKDFIIERAASGFIDLAGIKSPGLSAAPAIAIYACELLKAEGVLFAKKESFIDTREHICFFELSAEKKQALVAAQPAYGKVICRCETITEGEILACMASPIPPVSVDGVKRRVRAGMGRCQGGFCGPRVLEILARERKVADTDIMQDTKGTFILTGKTKGGADNV